MNKPISPVLYQFLEDVQTEVKHQGTSLFAVGQKISTERSYFGRYQKGIVSPNLKSMEKIAAVLNMKLVIRLESIT